MWATTRDGDGNVLYYLAFGLKHHPLQRHVLLLP